MGILAGDIKLVASQVMDDVPEGGGAPTSTVITDGTSNSIFNDISELDRAGGRVNLRKAFVSVQTNDTDGYFGANVIVADPPDDPNVSVALFTTGDVFDQRTSAQGRIESYLAQGTLYSGYLFGDHITGQGSVALLQREDVPLPVNGDTLVLRKNEGLSNQFDQYVRVTKVTSRTRSFTDEQGIDFKRVEVTLTISDTLRADFPGLAALRLDSQISYVGKTKVYSTIVADAARYYGVVPLTASASISDFTVQASGIFSQIVPSTKVEVPIADARMNQQSAALVSAGSTLTQTITIGFTTTQSMFVGGGILPGSLSLSRGGTTITDKGGVLISGGDQVGVIDYANGVLTLTTNVFGTSSGTHTVSYTPATRRTIVTESIGIPITQQGQRLTWVAALDPIPSRGSLQVNYRALGRWYVLNDDGSGALKGADSSFGAGTVNFTTGTVSLTLGALPDVGSQLVFAWAPSLLSRPIAAVPATGPGLAVALGKILKIDSIALKPSTISIAWNDGSSRTATDVNGVLTGDATGKVSYGAAEIDFRPNTLPAKGTTISVTVGETTPHADDVTAFTDGGSHWSFSLTGGIKPRSVDIAVYGTYPMRQNPGIDNTLAEIIHVFDDGSGNLQVANITTNATVGTIDYTTGACTINKSLSGYASSQPVYTTTTVMENVPSSGGGLVQQNPVTKVSLTSYEIRSVTLTLRNGGSGLGTVLNPSWAWWTGSVSSARARYAGADGSSNTYNFTFDEAFVAAAAGGITSFRLGTHLFSYSAATNTYVLDPSPTSGAGTNAGAQATYGGRQGVLLSSWPAGVTSTPTELSGATAPDVSGNSTPMLVENVTFRTAIAPLFNGGFSVSGTWEDGTTFTATPDSNGVIKTATTSVKGVVGKVDYDTGVVTLRFGKLGNAGPVVQDVSYLEITGVTDMSSFGVRSDTLRYNAVGYSYIPLDASILGLDPVRLPSDGRVPIFRPGTFAVVGNTQTTSPTTVSNAQTINCGRVRLSRVRVIGNNGSVINTGYTTDLEAGTVTFTDVTGYSQPVKVEHRIEDMMLVSDAQINGQLTFTRALTHNYPETGSYVSSALVVGDMHGRVSLTFDQTTWSNVWADTVSGSAATGTYNTVLAPIEVTNKGALTERWAIVFTNTTSFNVIGEHVGVIATGNTSTDLSPLNPATGSPYFTIRATGWGSGWATGNVLRFNTVGAVFPVWLIRTIQQGPETVTNDSFTVLIRGDVDNP